MRAAPSTHHTGSSLAPGFILSIAVCTLSIALFPAGHVAATDLPSGWVSFDGWTTEATAPTIQIISSDVNHIVIRIDTPGVLVETIEHEGTEFKRLGIPGYVCSGKVGHPALPAVRQLVAVPKGCTVTVSAVALDSLLFTGCTVYPVEAPVVRYTEEGWEYIDYEFAYDEQAYSRGGYSPGPWSEADDTGSFRGQGVVRLTAHPMQTDASKSELRAFPSVLVTLELTGGGGGMSEEIGPFSEIAEALVLGYKGSGSIGWRGGPADPGRWGVLRTLGACEDSLTDYLMIVEGSLMGSRHLNDLAEHRATYNGFNVAIVPDTTVFEFYSEAAISDTAIHHFIQSLYATESAEHMRDNTLGYVLLVGDARYNEPNALLPAHEVAINETTAITTDHWYACVEENDWFPDLMIGRLCVSDTTELGREVQKIVGYEENASSTDDWRTKILMTSGFCTEEDENKAATAHAAFEYARTLILDHTVTEIHADEQIGGNCGEKQGVVRTAQRESVSAGLHLLELCAHGAPHECDTFKDDDVALLENSEGQLPFWMNYSCSTGAYDLLTESSYNPWNCLGEALMHQEPNLTGTVGFFGASENSANAWADIGTYLWEAIFNHGHNRTGGFIIFAKLKFQALRADLDTNYRHDLMYNLLGDPALDILLTDTEGAGYSSAPDYVVRDQDITLVPAFPSVGEPTTIAVDVRNESNYIPGGPVDVLFELWNPGTSMWDLLATTQVQPGDWSSETTSTLWTTSSSYVGRTELRIRVDPDGEQDELSELNNEAERPVCVYIERDGFPVNMWGADGVAPAFVDINGDGRDDVVSGTRTPGHIAAFSSFSAESLWAYAVPSGSALLGPVSIADLSVDGDPEIVFTRTGYVDAFNLNGGSASGWSPRYMKGLVGAAALGDVAAGDSLGCVEIALQRMWTASGLQRRAISVVRHNGADVVWDVVDEINAQVASFVERSPIVVDLNGDGRGEVVAAYVTAVGAAEMDAAISAHASHNGDELWSVELFGQPSELPCSPVAADVVADSIGIEVLCAAGSVICLSSRGYSCWERDIDGAPAGLAVEDLDADGELEVIVATYHAPGSIVDCSGTLYVIDSGGSVVDSIATDRAFTTQPVMADLDGDDDMEILTMSCRDEVWGLERKTISHLDIFTFNAGTLERFDELERPFLFWGMATGTPAIRDTDQDGFLEIWIADGEGLLHCLDLAQLNLSGEPSRWPCFQHDERHTGVYETPVSGPYPVDTEASWWGDYLLTGDVTIHGTSSLLVQAGTTVRVASGDDQESGVEPNAIELIIQGNVVALGDTASAPIRFISAGSSRSSIDWYGIRLLPCSSAEFEGCIVKDAFIGISAQRPSAIRVEDCRIVECDAVGVKCINHQGWGDVLIRGNLIADAETGIHLGWCAATVDTNTITGCGSYGIKMVFDYESDIIGNTIYFPYSASGGPFSGISVDGTNNRRQNTLEISDNTITNARTSGITCKNQGLQSEVYISSNKILVEQYHPTSKAMYFDSSWAVPRNNEIWGTRDAFWIETATIWGESPNLGITVGDGGYNLLDGNWLRYGVRADPYCLTEVRAEANWWGTANPGDPLFMGLVDWHPFLAYDPRDTTRVGGGEEDYDEVPFCLIQNSPNPFNPVTSLRYGLPARQHVSLSIYDVAGRRVTTLVDDTLDPGWHDIVWDGRDDAQHRVSSGVYFCRLISQGSTSVKKVVLLK